MALGKSPTLREICEEFDFANPSTAMNHITAMVRKGYLHKEPNKARAIYLADDSRVSLRATIIELERIVASLNSRRLLRHYQAVIDDLKSIADKKVSPTLGGGGSSHHGYRGVMTLTGQTNSKAKV